MELISNDWTTLYVINKKTCVFHGIMENDRIDAESFI